MGCNEQAPIVGAHFGVMFGHFRPFSPIMTLCRGVLNKLENICNIENFDVYIKKSVKTCFF